MAPSVTKNARTGDLRRTGKSASAQCCRC